MGVIIVLNILQAKEGFNLLMSVFLLILFQVFERHIEITS